MEYAIKKSEDAYHLEMEVDTDLFPLPICLKAAYTFLDKGYFFFRKGEKKNILIIQVKSKNIQKWDSELLISDFSDELLATTLRDSLEKENKTIRETIVKRALGSMMDEENFINGEKKEQSYIDFTKDINEILGEIEDTLIADEGGISESSIEAEKKHLEPNKVFQAKKKFSKR